VRFEGRESEVRFEGRESEVRFEGRESEVRFEGRETSIGRATDGIAEVGVLLRDFARLVCVDHQPLPLARLFRVWVLGLQV
jgi:hypothetical protein